VWEPPPGFVPAAPKAANLEDASKAWVDGAPTGTFVARASLAHSAGTGPVEERDLATIVEGLPETFAKEGVEWTHRRHETRVRADGARVGIIEGDCVSPRKSLIPGLSADLKFRRLQLVFPDDAGTSIVTAQFATDEAGKWEPVFEASIGKARGVATRVPPAPPWMMLAWGGAGAVLGWLASAMLASRKDATAAPPAKKAEPDDDEDEEEEDT
jgi:hypothetical protein